MDSSGNTEDRSTEEKGKQQTKRHITQNELEIKTTQGIQRQKKLFAAYANQMTKNIIKNARRKVFGKEFHISKGKVKSSGKKIDAYQEKAIAEDAIDRTSNAVRYGLKTIREHGKVENSGSVTFNKMARNKKPNIVSNKKNFMVQQNEFIAKVAYKITRNIIENALKVVDVKEENYDSVPVSEKVKQRKSEVDMQNIKTIFQKRETIQEEAKEIVRNIINHALKKIFSNGKRDKRDAEIPLTQEESLVQEYVPNKCASKIFEEEFRMKLSSNVESFSSLDVEVDAKKCAVKIPQRKTTKLGREHNESFSSLVVELDGEKYAECIADKENTSGDINLKNKRKQKNKLEEKEISETYVKEICSKTISQKRQNIEADAKKMIREIINHALKKIRIDGKKDKRDSLLCQKMYLRKKSEKLGKKAKTTGQDSNVMAKIAHKITVNVIEHALRKIGANAKRKGNNSVFVHEIAEKENEILENIAVDKEKQEDRKVRLKSVQEGKKKSGRYFEKSCMAQRKRNKKNRNISIGFNLGSNVIYQENEALHNRRFTERDSPNCSSDDHITQQYPMEIYEIQLRESELLSQNNMQNVEGPLIQDESLVHEYVSNNCASDEIFEEKVSLEYMGEFFEQESLISVQYDNDQSRKKIKQKNITGIQSTEEVFEEEFDSEYTGEYSERKSLISAEDDNDQSRKKIDQKNSMEVQLIAKEEFFAGNNKLVPKKHERAAKHIRSNTVKDVEKRENRTMRKSLEEKKMLSSKEEVISKNHLITSTEEEPPAFMEDDKNTNGAIHETQFLTDNESFSSLNVEVDAKKSTEKIPPQKSTKLEREHKESFSSLVVELDGQKYVECTADEENTSHDSNLERKIEQKNKSEEKDIPETYKKEISNKKILSISKDNIGTTNLNKKTKKNNTSLSKVDMDDISWGSFFQPYATDRKSVIKETLSAEDKVRKAKNTKIKRKSTAEIYLSENTGSSKSYSQVIAEKEDPNQVHKFFVAKTLTIPEEENKLRKKSNGKMETKVLLTEENLKSAEKPIRDESSAVVKNDDQFQLVINRDLATENYIKNEKEIVKTTNIINRELGDERKNSRDEEPFRLLLDRKDVAEHRSSLSHRKIPEDRPRSSVNRKLFEERRRFSVIKTPRNSLAHKNILENHRFSTDKKYLQDSRRSTTNSTDIIPHVQKVGNLTAEKENGTGGFETIQTKGNEMPALEEKEDTQGERIIIYEISNTETKHDETEDITEHKNKTDCRLIENAAENDLKPSSKDAKIMNINRNRASSRQENRRATEIIGEKVEDDRKNSRQEEPYRLLIDRKDVEERKQSFAKSKIVQKRRRSSIDKTLEEERHRFSIFEEILEKRRSSVIDNKNRKYSLGKDENLFVVKQNSTEQHKNFQMNRNEALLLKEKVLTSVEEEDVRRNPFIIPDIKLNETTTEKVEHEKRKISREGEPYRFVLDKKDVYERRFSLPYKTIWERRRLSSVEKRLQKERKRFSIDSKILEERRRLFRNKNHFLQKNGNSTALKENAVKDSKTLETNNSETVLLNSNDVEEHGRPSLDKEIVEEGNPSLLVIKVVEEYHSAPTDAKIVEERHPSLLDMKVVEEYHSAPTDAKIAEKQPSFVLEKTMPKKSQSPPLSKKKIVEKRQSDLEKKILKEKRKRNKRLKRKMAEKKAKKDREMTRRAANHRIKRNAKNEEESQRSSTDEESVQKRSQSLKDRKNSILMGYLQRKPSAPKKEAKTKKLVSKKIIRKIAPCLPGKDS